jgi:hypothetical protein
MPIDWGVNLVRLSIFCTENATASDATWKMLTGQGEAENRVAAPGGRTFSGTVGDGLLALTHSGPRLDLVYQAKGTDTPDPEIPLLGPWPAVRDTFGKMSTALLSSITQPIVRLAVGGVLLAKAETVEQSYERLRDLLKSVKIDPKKTRDLHYRVNWALDDEVEGLKINRITTWASMRFNTTFMQITGDKVAVAGTPAKGLFAVRLEVDHNTDALNQEPLGHNKLMPIYQHLVALIDENAEKGEVLS